eukprot:12699324-Ditylum_brightwellii.AAC.1
MNDELFDLVEHDTQDGVERSKLDRQKGINDDSFNLVGACYTCNDAVMKGKNHMMVLAFGKLVMASPRMLF